MNGRMLGLLALLTLSLILAGCTSGTPGTGGATPQAAKEEVIKANLAKLSAEDRPLAEAQTYCPVTEERLGDPTMGVPVKVMVKEQPVFLCCKSCQKKALADPDGTLNKVKELTAKGGASKS